MLRCIPIVALVGLIGIMSRTDAHADLATVSTIYRFSAVGTGNANEDGAHPVAALLQAPDGSFYGTTGSGGAAGTGTVFNVTSSGELTTLHAFSRVNGHYANHDGASPDGALIQGSDGEYLGTTAGGGTRAWGTIFRIAPGGSLTTPHTFTDTSGDGAKPASALVQGSDGNFYGTTVQGGTYDGGTVFKMSPSGAVTILHSFTARIDNDSNTDG